MNPFRFLTVIGIASLLVISSRLVSADEREDFFETKIRPILLDTCFRCHNDLKAGGTLRIDSREALLKGGESGPAIVPGQPTESLLIRAIQRQADVSAMPPEKDKGLRADQVAAFVKWVKTGAIWPAKTAKFETAKHWAFLPIREISPPVVQDKSWVKNDIDSFIRAKQEAVGLKPVAAANKLTLIRRATFDLTGLPPTWEDIQAFEQDNSSNAFATVVDRLLASRAYGERWGRHWLDVVRYADTAGETADYPVREAWKYRNYVIDAFNHDKPYDEFIREQIAGDLFALDQAQTATPEKFSERVTATGYIATSRRFGFDSINYQHLCIQDTIDTLGQSILGLSLGCARCHDHKYDPVSAADYYALYGIFASTKYAFPGDEQTKRPRDFVPLIPPPAAMEQQKAYDLQLAAFDAQSKQFEAEKQAIVVELAKFVEFDGGFELQAENKPLQKPWTGVDGAITTTAAQSPFTNVYQQGKFGVHFPNDARNNAIVQPLPARTAKDTQLLYFNIDFRSTSPAKEGEGTYRFYLGHGPGPSAAVEFFANATTFFVRHGDAIEEVRRLETNTWYNVQLVLNLADRTFAGIIGKPGDLTNFSGKAFHPKCDGTIDHFFIDGYGHVGANSAVKSAHEADNVAIRTTPLLPVGETSADAELASFAADRVKKSAELQAKVATLNQQLGDLARQKSELVERGPFAVAYAVKEGEAKHAKIHKRGEPLQLGDEVPRRFLQILGGDPLPAEEKGSGRRQLAAWLTRPENPLTARVIVNRIWQHHFGAGIVGTENDFGVRGKAPTHPELLDYLAHQFMKTGWSIKSLHRQLMLSNTYQLVSKLDAPTAMLDPTNELLSHFNPRRLDAEELRDALLFHGGQLDPSMGAGHPFPPVGSWGYTQHNPFAALYDTNRRSVYLMTQRSTRHPFLALFDGVDTNTSTAERKPTTVPTQALFWMNDSLVHAQSLAYARRLIGQTAEDTARLRIAYQQLLSRNPEAEELQQGLEFIEQYRQQLQPSKQPPPQHTEIAWAAFIRTIFSSNEFAFID